MQNLGFRFQKAAPGCDTKKRKVEVFFISRAGTPSIPPRTTTKQQQQQQKKKKKIYIYI